MATSAKYVCNSVVGPDTPFCIKEKTTTLSTKTQMPDLSSMDILR